MLKSCPTSSGFGDFGKQYSVICFLVFNTGFDIRDYSVEVIFVTYDVSIIVFNDSVLVGACLFQEGWGGAPT